MSDHYGPCVRGQMLPTRQHKWDTQMPTPFWDQRFRMWSCAPWRHRRERHTSPQITKSIKDRHGSCCRPKTCYIFQKIDYILRKIMIMMGVVMYIVFILIAATW